MKSRRIYVLLLVLIGITRFAAGTPIHTDHGDVPVEKVEVGDEVQSRNRETGKLESERVSALTPLHKDSLLALRSEGERTPLRPSLDHPFWVKRGTADHGHWIEAANLIAGVLGGLAGVGMLELHCPNFQAAHVLVWHTAVVPLSGASGSLAACSLRFGKGSGTQVSADSE